LFDRSSLERLEAASKTSLGTDVNLMPARRSSSFGKLVFPTVGFGAGSGGVAEVANGAVLCAALNPES
jgi:hypothetical protein